MEHWLSLVPKEEDYDDDYIHREDIFTQAIKEWCESYPNLLNWKQDIYHYKFGVSIYCSKPEKDYKQILEIYDSIKDANISPPLVHHEIIYNKYPIFVYMLVTERYGKDLGELFIGEGNYLGSTSLNILDDSNEFDQAFPKNKIPNKVRQQILPLFQRFYDIGWIHNDIWCANLLLKDDVVKLIDFEYCSKVI